MYYAAKGLELLGMSMIAVGFIVKFPKLMDPKLLLGAIICFGTFRMQGFDSRNRF